MIPSQELEQRRKRTRRVIVVLVGVLLIGGVLGGLYAMQYQRRAAHIENLKPRGLAELEAGDYRKAMNTLRGYLGSNPTDLEALHALAEARENVYERGGGHIKQAMEIRRRILELDPDDEQTRRDLMELYLQVGFNTEAIEQADHILQHHEDDPQALRIKAHALHRNRSYDRAIETATRYNELKPLDIEMQMLTVAIMQAAGERNDQVIAHARDLVNQHPDDSRFQMVLGYAQQIIGHLDDARDAYTLAAENIPQDADEVSRLAELMDRVGLFNEATQLLGRAEESIDDPMLVRLYIRRLYEQGRRQEVLDRAEAFDVDDPRADTDALGVLALTLIESDRDERAAAFIDQLQKRSDEQLARSWRSVLIALRNDELEADRLVNVLASALTHHGGHPYFHFYHGEALLQQGDTEEAIQAWQTAGQRAPAWPRPLVRMAETFMSTQRPTLASQVAQAAVQRAPNNPEALVRFLQSLAPQLDRLDEQRLSQISEWTEGAAAQLPTAVQRQLLPLRVGLQARGGETEAARQLIRDHLQADPPLNGQLLMQLAAVSENQQLDMTERLLDTYEQTWGLNPQLAFGRALYIADHQGVEPALAAYRQAADAADNADDPIARQWDLFEARLIDRLKPDQALQTWRTLIEKYPDDRAVIETALDSSRLWTDPALAGLAVGRLRELAGEQSVAWRVARARLLMVPEDAGQRELAEASSLLLEVTRQSPYLLEPHLLLAGCFERLENKPRALDLLNEAQGLAPQSIDIALRRARLMQDTEQGEDAARLLDALAQRPALSSTQQLQLAALLARQDRIADAETFLRQILADQPDQHRAKLMLANLLRHRQQTEEAARLFEELLEQPDGQTLRAAIAFYEDIGDDPRVEDLLSQLEQTQVNPDDRAMLRAGFAMRQGRPDEALAELQAVVRRPEASADVWRQLIAVQMQLGQTDAAVDAAARAADAHPDQPMFTIFAENAELIRAVQDQPMLRRLTAALLAGSDFRDAALQVLRLVVDANDQQRPIADVAVDLRQIADRHPRFLALQSVMMQIYRSMGRQSDVAQLAVRTMRVLPNSAEAAWLAAGALAEAGQWDEALSAAREFQRRAGDASLQSDLMIAEAQLQLGQGSAAAEQLQPHLNASQSAEASVIVHHAQARALIQQGLVDEARNLLRPSLDQSAPRRAAYMELALRALEDPDQVKQWFLDVKDAIPADAPDERLQLARFWQSAASRWNRDDFQQQAVELLTRLAREDQVGGSALETLGIIHEQLGQADQAADAYRQALEKDPELPIALNNLAMILLQRGEATEALSLAERAVELAPRAPALQDTLALVLLANDRPEAAVEAARRAASLQPDRLEWYLTLGEAMVAAEQADDARRLLEELDRSLQNRPALPDAAQQRLDALRRAVDQAPVLGAR